MSIPIPKVYPRTHMVTRLTVAVKEAGGVRRFAQDTHISVDHVLEVLATATPPCPTLCRKLKLEPVPMYREVR